MKRNSGVNETLISNVFSNHCAKNLDFKTVLVYLNLVIPTSSKFLCSSSKQHTVFLLET